MADGAQGRGQERFVTGYVYNYVQSSGLTDGGRVGLMQESGEGASPTGAGAAKIPVNLQKSLAGQVGADVRRWKRHAQKPDRGGAKQAGIATGGPTFHPWSQLGLRELRQRGENLKQKGRGPVVSDQTGGRRKHAPVPPGVEVPKGV